MQTQAVTRARTDAVVGAALVGGAAVILGAILSIQGGTSPAATTQDEAQRALIEFRAGERAMFFPASGGVTEEQALIEFRRAEREER